MQQIHVLLIAISAFAAWIFTVVNALKMIRHRKPEIPLSTFAINGIKFFNPDNFTPEAKPYFRNFMTGFGAFFLCVFLGLAVGFFLSSR